METGFILDSGQKKCPIDKVKHPVSESLIRGKKSHAEITTPRMQTWIHTFLQAPFQMQRKNYHLNQKLHEAQAVQATFFWFKI